jgi:acetyl-CoA carboxylase biotin carboxyl carrier protein
MIMNEETIRKLIRILKEEEVDEIEVRRGLTKIRVVRRRMAEAATGALPAAGETADALHTPGETVQPPPEETVPPGADSRPSPPIPAADAVGSAAMTEIKSPMVGTFYRSPNPESEPFVVEGGRVEIGNVLCIIEAMKLMNEIESDTSGIIRKILVEDAEPVEFGQPLFLVESA